MSLRLEPTPTYLWRYEQVIFAPEDGDFRCDFAQIIIRRRVSPVNAPVLLRPAVVVRPELPRPHQLDVVTQGTKRSRVRRVTDDLADLLCGVKLAGIETGDDKEKRGTERERCGRRSAEEWAKGVHEAEQERRDELAEADDIHDELNDKKNQSGISGRNLRVKILRLTSINGKKGDRKSVV